MVSLAIVVPLGLSGAAPAAMSAGHLGAGQGDGEVAVPGGDSGGGGEEEGGEGEASRLQSRGRVLSLKIASEPS